jgi:hypothetical protein
VRLGIAPGLVLATVILGGCVYYNAMWNAERLATEAGRAEREGREAEARQRWAQAAVKAESVHIRHPTSGWADDALLLQGRALLAVGDCRRALAPLVEAERQAQDEDVREEARLLAGQCQFRLGAAAAETLLITVAESRNRGRASRARLWLGRVAVARGNLREGIGEFERSSEREARLARAHAWIVLGDVERGTSIAESLSVTPFREPEWTSLLDTLGAHGGQPQASRLVDRLATTRGVPSGARARFLAADGDRWLAGADTARARARWAEAERIAPDSAAGALGRVARLRMDLQRTRSLAELPAFQREASRAAALGGAPAAEAQRLNRAITQVLSEPDDAVAGLVRAETARDSLGAPALSATLFRDVQVRWPESVFAPKALIAAATLDPDGASALLASARERYGQSPYMRALAGETDPAYAVAEDSLRQALGLAAQAELAQSAHVAPPTAGPRTVLEPEAMPIDAVRDAGRARPPAQERPRRPVINDDNEER